MKEQPHRISATANEEYREFPLDFPAGITVDKKGILQVVMRWGLHAVVSVSPTWEVQRIIGGISAGYKDGEVEAAMFNHPQAVAVAPDNSLIISDIGNSCIRKISPSGQTSTVAGNPRKSGISNGAPETARFQVPNGVAVEANGNIIVSDSGNHVLRRILLDDS
mmetsp:Transcript_29889/g.47927  ORF Transcript_29889/g.47927 Transcript_29889/m.47927 type:complete len:164 (+) Transcript_29889:615-1106(+)